jgi:hypothetical protein
MGSSAVTGYHACRGGAGAAARWAVDAHARGGGAYVCAAARRRRAAKLSHAALTLLPSPVSSSVCEHDLELTEL